MTTKTTKTNVSKALDAAGFRGVELFYCRNARYWYFGGGEADEWVSSAAAATLDSFTVCEWVEVARFLRAQ